MSIYELQKVMKQTYSRGTRFPSLGVLLQDLGVTETLQIWRFASVLPDRGSKMLQHQEQITKQDHGFTRGLLPLEGTGIFLR